MTTDDVREITILRTKLNEAETEAQRATRIIRAQAGAIMDVDFKIRHSMKQLLTANDVKKDKAMRENILEIMNELTRFAQNRFEVAGIKIDSGNTTESH